MATRGNRGLGQALLDYTPEQIRNQQDYGRSRQLAQMLMDQGATGSPVATPLEGLARLGTTLVGAWSDKQAADKFRADEGKREITTGNALAAAMREGMGTPARTESYNDGTTINWSERKGNPQQMAALLAGNPETADLGINMQFQNMAADRERQAMSDMRSAENETWLKRFDTQEAARQSAADRQFKQQQELQDRLFRQQSSLLEKRLGGAGDFGSSTRGKVLEILSGGVSSGQTNTPEYAAAYAEFSQPKPSWDPTTGQMILVRPDLSMFPKPGPIGALPPNAPAVLTDPGQGVPQAPTPPAASPPIVEIVGDVREGSKADEARREADERAKNKLELEASTARQIRTGFDLLNHPGRAAATGATSFLSVIPGTDARGFSAQLETFKTQAFLPAVQQLRGLGALSNAEGQKLEAAIGALDPAMPEAEFEKSLKTILGDLEGGYKRAFGRTPSEAQSAASPLDDARRAIAAGANREAVIQRLRERGIDPGGL